MFYCINICLRELEVGYLLHFHVRNYEFIHIMCDFRVPRGSENGKIQNVECGEAKHHSISLKLFLLSYFTHTQPRKKVELNWKRSGRLQHPNLQ